MSNVEQATVLEMNKINDRMSVSLVDGGHCMDREINKINERDG